MFILLLFKQKVYISIMTNFKCINWSKVWNPEQCSLKAACLRGRAAAKIPLRSCNNA